MLYDLNNKLNSDDYLVEENLLLNEYQEKRNQVHKKMHTTFPKIKKWTNYSMMIIPTVSLGGVLSGSNLLTSLGIGFEVIGGMVQFSLDYMENKNKWSCFKFENEFGCTNGGKY